MLLCKVLVVVAGIAELFRLLKPPEAHACRDDKGLLAVVFLYLGQVGIDCGLVDVFVDIAVRQQRIDGA